MGRVGKRSWGNRGVKSEYFQDVARGTGGIVRRNIGGGTGRTG